MRIGVGVCTYKFPEQVEWWAKMLHQISRSIKASVVISSADDVLPECPGVPVVHGPNLGVAHTKNRALNHLIGDGCDPIVLAEDDCRFNEEFLKYLWHMARSGIPHLMIGPVTQSHQTWRLTDNRVKIAGLWFRNYVRVRDPQDTPGVITMVTRSAVDKCGGLDSGFVGRGHAHGEWTHRIHQIMPSQLASPYWHPEVADSLVEHVERPRYQRPEDEAERIKKNKELRQVLASNVSRVPNLDYLSSGIQRPVPVHPISVCMSLKNRHKTLKGCLDSIAKWFMVDGAPNELVISDFGSTDCDPQKEMDSRDIPGKVVPLCGEFSRARGLHAAQMAARHPLLFFCDADMLLPETMGRMIRIHVQPGSCFFPVCWSLDKNGNGKWRRTGYGMVGIHADDYDAVGGWNLDRRSWGGEDDDFHWHCHHRALRVERRCVSGLVHQWHRPVVTRHSGQWKTPEVRGEIRPPIQAINVDTSLLRHSVEQWGFHLETVEQFKQNIAILSEETAYFRGVLEYKRDGGTLWAMVGSQRVINNLAIKKYTETFRQLFISMRSAGFAEENPISARVSGHGRFDVLDGHHRLACAIGLGIDAVPLRVRTRAVDWVVFRDLLFEQYKEEKLYTQIPHPDFSGWTIARDIEERSAAISLALRGAKTILDVGCCTGGIAMALSASGFNVTAVEKNDSALGLANRIEKTFHLGRSSVNWRQGNAWDMELPKHDVVVCLSVLHHALKNNSFKQTVSWLKSRGSVFVIEMADATETQMQGVAIPKDQENIGQMLAETFDLEATPILRGVPANKRKSASDRRWLWMLR